MPTPKGWQWVKLTDVARLETGHTPSRKYSEYWDGDIPWIGIKDATGNHGKIIDDTLQHVTQAGIDNSSARVLPANTVCLSRTASVGYVVVMGRPMATSQDFVNWVCSDEIDYRYLAAILYAENASYSQFSRGTTHQTIYFPEAKAFHVLLPPKEEQVELADIIWSLNDKIELNRQTNQTLEQIAQAIFKSWFVDFEPTRAKIQAKKRWQALNDTTETSSPTCYSEELDTPNPAQQQQPNLTLDQAMTQAAMAAISGKTIEEVEQLSPEQQQQLKTIADLFPDALVESELGEIPEGWEIRSLCDFGKVVTGKTPPKKVEDAFADSGVSFITPSDIDESIYVTLTSRYLSETGQNSVKKTKVGAGSICVTCIGSQMGKTIVAPRESFTNQQINSITVSKEYYRNFLCLNLRNRREEIFLIGSSGSTMPIINKSTFEKLTVISPDDSLLVAFDGVVSVLFNKILESDMESLGLAKIRDVLLPKLLSGQMVG